MCVIWKKQVIEHDLLPIYKSKRIKNKQDHNDTFLNSIVDFLWEGIVSYSIRSLNESLIDHNIEIIEPNRLTSPNIIFINSGSLGDSLEILCDIYWKSDIPLQIRSYILGLAPYVTLDNITISGRFIIELRNRLINPPFFSICKIQTEKTPYISINANTFNSEICNIISHTFKRIINENIVYPNELHIDLVNNNIALGLQPRTFLGNLYIDVTIDNHVLNVVGYYFLRIIFGNWEKESNYLYYMYNLKKISWKDLEIPIFFGYLPKISIEIWKYNYMFTDTIIKHTNLENGYVKKLIDDENTTQYFKKEGVNVLTKWKSTKEIMKSESAIFIDVISWNYINEFNKKFKKKKKLFLKIIDLENTKKNTKIKQLSGPFSLKLPFLKPNTIELHLCSFSTFSKYPTVHSKYLLTLEYAANGCRHTLHTIEFKDNNHKLKNNTILTMTCNIRTYN